MRIKIEVRIYDNENQKYNQQTREFDRLPGAFQEVNRELSLEIPNAYLGMFQGSTLAAIADLAEVAYANYAESDPAMQPKEEHSNHQEIPNPEALGELPF